MSSGLALFDALDEDCRVTRDEASRELMDHGQSLLAYFVDHPEEMYKQEFSSRAILIWLGY